MKGWGMKFEPGYMDPRRVSLEFSHCGCCQNDLKESCAFSREGYGEHHVWRETCLIPHLNGGIISRMGSWEEGVCILSEGILKTREKTKVEGQGREDGDNTGRPGSRKGHPYRSSKGLRLRGFFWEGPGV
jgi:hypothetical protein